MLAKFHRNILNLSENIAKSFRGATFFDSHCRYVLGCVVSGQVGHRSTLGQSQHYTCLLRIVRIAQKAKRLYRMLLCIAWGGVIWGQVLGLCLRHCQWWSSVPWIFQDSPLLKGHVPELTSLTGFVLNLNSVTFRWRLRVIYVCLRWRRNLLTPTFALASLLWKQARSNWNFNALYGMASVPDWLLFSVIQHIRSQNYSPLKQNYAKIATWRMKV